MFETFEKNAAEFMKQWEQAAGQWWDGTLSDPANLEKLGTFLTDACNAKERGDRALEDHWNRWRLPSAADIERMHERMADMEHQLDRIESLLRAQAAAATPAAAAAE